MKVEIDINSSQYRTQQATLTVSIGSCDDVSFTIKSRGAANFQEQLENGGLHIHANDLLAIADLIRSKRQF